MLLWCFSSRVGDSFSLFWGSPLQWLALSFSFFVWKHCLGCILSLPLILLPFVFLWSAFLNLVYSFGICGCSLSSLGFCNSCWSLWLVDFCLPTAYTGIPCVSGFLHFLMFCKFLIYFCDFFALVYLTVWDFPCVFGILTFPCVLSLLTSVLFCSFVSYSLMYIICPGSSWRFPWWNSILVVTLFV